MANIYTNLIEKSFLTCIGIFILLYTIYLVVADSNLALKFFLGNWFPILNGGALFILTTALSDQTSS